MIIALGSDRAAKIMAVRSAVAQISTVDARWHEASITARAVETGVPAMPVTDWELMHGARHRALAVRDQLETEGSTAHLYLGLEGGFHSLQVDDEWHTFL